MTTPPAASPPSVPLPAAIFPCAPPAPKTVPPSTALVDSALAALPAIFCCPSHIQLTRNDGQWVSLAPSRRPWLWFSFLSVGFAWDS